MTTGVPGSLVGESVKRPPWSLSMSDRLDVTVSEFVIIGYAVILRVEGDITAVNCATVQRGLIHALALQQPSHIVIDLTELRSCDSHGLAALIGADKYVRETGGRMMLAGTNDPVRWEMRRQGLAGMFVFRDSVGQAVVELKMGDPA
ncbi:STAS domain-containing protein [Streptosporangium sp. NPDC002721]|uniref:STAS domain-containing protein n=1 Tax=Streptosporangium sp. NPDC002721 TaxID=3366188 RepID=UPI0036957991